MQVLLPYLVLTGAALIAALLVAALFRHTSIGIVGNGLTGIAGGLIASMGMQWILHYLPGVLPTWGAIGFIAGGALMLVVGLSRRRFFPDSL